MSKNRKLLLSAGLFLLLCALVPLIYSVFNVGNWLLLGGGAACALLALCWPALERRVLLRRLSVTAALCALAATLAVSCLIGWRAWCNPPPAGGKQTLIVLGARVYASGPSRMLRYRLDKARRYLESNPEAVCIVSGGQGADEPCSEAAAMADYLAASGIDRTRLLLEDKSTNTDENIRFSLPLIPEDSQGIVIVTNDFHQMRASLYAARYGLEPYALSCFTPPGLLPAYWMREVGGVPFAWLQAILQPAP